MKQVTFTVEFCAEVPDDAEEGDLCLNMDTDLIEVEDLNIGKVPGSRVTSYTTIQVTNDNQQEE